MALTITKKPPQLILANQPVAFTVQSSISETPLRILGAVYWIGGDSVQADAQKNASFEFSDYLKNLTTQKGKTGNTPQAYSEIPKHISFIFQEIAGTPPQNYAPLETETFLLLDAYIPKSKRQSFYFEYANLLSYLATSKSCLTWWPVNELKRVLPSQKECINFMQVRSLTPIPVQLDLSLRFTDGTYLFFQDIVRLSNVAYGTIVYFPTGYSQLGVGNYASNAYPDKILLSYSVTLSSGSYNQDNNISKIYSYLVDFGYYQNPRILVFKNPFGLYEYVLCTGTSQQDNAIKTETAVTDGLVIPDKLNWKTTRSDVVKVNTGFLGAEQIHWLADLLESTETFELIGTLMQPIVFRDVELPVVHTGIFQYQAELEYEYAYSEIIEIG